MEFPGTNKLTLDKKAILQMVANALGEKLGSNVRITDISWLDYRGYAEVEFTTDPPEATQTEDKT